MKKLAFVIMILLLINTITWTSSSKKVVGEILEVKEIQDILKNEILKVKIIEGKYNGEIITIEREVIECSIYDFDLNIGDKILIELYLNDSGSLCAKFINVWRVDKIKNLTLIFVISVIIFGGLKGILSISSLLFSTYIILKFMVPGILKGYNIIMVSMLSALIIIVTSFILIAGFTKKSLVSMLGTIGGTIIAGLLAYTYSKLANITGVADENVMFLITNIGLELDFGNLYMSSILIGSIGAVMDVSMSITTSMFEIKKQSPKITTKNLIQSGFQIGKDIMSTMTNTLILAYTGSSMPLIIINVLYDYDFIYAINNEMLAMEIIRSLCCSIGLVMTIPLTVLIAANSIKQKNISSRQYRYNK